MQGERHRRSHYMRSHPARQIHSTVPMGPVERGRGGRYKNLGSKKKTGSGGRPEPVYGMGRWIIGGDGRIRTGDRGFADPCLNHLATSPKKSGRGDSNPRPSPWQGDVLPLNYTRVSHPIFLRWTRPDSNRRSPPCKGGAFPARPRARSAYAVMPTRGFEPPRPVGQQILSLPRLPFRHVGPLLYVSYAKQSSLSKFAEAEESLHMSIQRSSKGGG